MNKKHLFALALALGTLAPAPADAALSLPNVKDAQEQAKKADKPVLILWHGSDWMGAAGGKLCAAWEKLKAAENLPVVLGQYDDTLGQERGARGKVLCVTEYNLPAAVLLLPDGTFYASYTGKRVRTAEAMMKTLTEGQADLQKFRQLVDKARSSKGEEAAKAAGDAMRLMSFEDARRCTALQDIIKREDPQNKTGYKEIFLQRHDVVINDLKAVMEFGGKNGKNRDFAGAEAAARKVLSRSDLTKEARQRYLAALAYVQREKFNELGNNDWKDFLKTCAEIVKVDPKTDYAEGARFFIDYYDTKKPCIITSDYYDSRVMPKFFDKPWHVDVSASMDGPGTYEFTLKPYPKSNMNLETRDFSLTVNGKVVARVPGKVEYGKPVSFPNVSAVPAKAKVEVRCTVRCNDGGLGCIGRIEMKKQ